MEKRILHVRKLSDALRVRLKELKKSDADLLLNLDEEELLDMYKVTQLADYLFTKHEHKKQVRDLVAEFVDSMHTSADLIRRIDAETDEMTLAAGDSLSEIMQAKARLGLKPENTSGINLTKLSSAVFSSPICTGIM